MTDEADKRGQLIRHLRGCSSGRGWNWHGVLANRSAFAVIDL